MVELEKKNELQLGLYRDPKNGEVRSGNPPPKQVQERQTIKTKQASSACGSWRAACEAHVLERGCACKDFLTVMLVVLLV